MESKNHQRIKSVLLIDIPTYHVKLPDLHRELLDKRLRFQSIVFEERVGLKLIRPSLTYSRGLLTLAACLEHDGYAVKYLIHSDPYDRTRILELAKEADVACVSIMTPTFNIAASIISNIKHINKDCITIVGGPHVNSLFDNVLLECADIDFAMIGECESRLPEFLRDIENPTKISGLAYRDSGVVRTTTSNFEPIIVSELPLPAYHLLSRNLSEYAHNIKTIRGCPYKCGFCAERLSWTSIHSSSQSLTQVVDEIKMISQHLKPNTLVHFSDAIFNINWDRTSELLVRLRREAPHIKFSGDTRVDLIESDQIRTLSETNFVCIRMGFESVHNNILQISTKSSSAQKQEEASGIIRDVSKNIAIHAYMVTGLPGTKRDTLALDTIQIPNIVKSGMVDIVGNKILVPYPGTPFYDTPLEHGIRILTRDWSLYDRRSFPTYELENLPANEIYFGYLHQEAALSSAYMEILGDNSHRVDDDNLTLDYIYSNYVTKTGKYSNDKD